MLGTTPRLKLLDLRKQLLIAESELCRIELLHESQVVAEEVRALADRAKSFVSIGTTVSAAALLLAGLTTCRSGLSAPTGGKPSWLQKLISGARLASTVWFAWRGRRQDAKPR